MLLSKIEGHTQIGIKDGQALSIDILYHSVARLVTKIHCLNKNQNYIFNKMISLEILFDIQFSKTDIVFMIQKS